MHRIYRKPPLNNSAYKWGAWWSFGDQRYLWLVNLPNIQSWAPNCSGPRASAPPSNSPLKGISPPFIPHW